MMKNTTQRIAGIAVLLVIVLTCQLGTLEAKEIQVYILAGQSNMEGHGTVERGRTPGDEEYKNKKPIIEAGVGSLRHMVNTKKDQFGPKGKLPLVDKDGNWLVRDDVYVYYPMKNRKGRHTVGFGVRPVAIGPEFGFGHVMGAATKSKVLIIKTCWGGKSLFHNFLPPSIGQYPEPVKPEDSGFYYKEMLKVVKDATTNLGSKIPELKGYTPRIAGIGWHQGWNDGGNIETVNAYEKNMVHFIKDVRKDLGIKDLPFVIANAGQQGFGFEWSGGRRKVLCEMQLAAGDPAKHPEFKGNVFPLETRQFCRLVGRSPSGQGYHWHGNGESYFLIGKAMADAMLHLLEPRKYPAPENPPLDTTTNAGTVSKK